MEQENNNNSTLTSDVNSQRGWRKYTWLIVLIIIAVLGLVYWTQANKPDQEVLDLKPSEVEQLEGDEKKEVLETQLKDLENKAAQLTPESDKGDRFNTYIQLAEVYSGLGLHDQAIGALDKIKDERSGNTRLWMTYAQVYKNKGDMVMARTSVRAALAIDPELANNWLYMFEVSKDLSASEQDALYQEALRSTNNDPKIVEVYNNWKASQTPAQ